MRTFTLLVSFFFWLPLSAQDVNETMQAFVWKQRVLMLFAADNRDSRMLKQDAILDDVPGALTERDVVVIRARADSPLVIDSVPQTVSSNAFYKHYAIEANQFRVLLIGKDGTVKLQQDMPVSAWTLFEIIDAMPMRQYEMLQNDD